MPPRKTVAKKHAVATKAMATPMYTGRPGDLHSLLIFAGEHLTLVRKYQGKNKSWLLTEIHRAFPKLTGCGSAPVCLIVLVQQHVTSMPIAKRILPKLQDLVQALYNPTTASGTQYMTKINNLFVGRQELHAYSTKVMKRTKIQKQLEMKRATDGVYAKNVNPIDVSYRRVVQLISDNIHANEWWKIAFALELASGSRKIELLSTKVSTFAKVVASDIIKAHGVTGKMYEWIRQNGVAKQYDGDRNDREIVKPLLVITATQFLAARQRLVQVVGSDVNTMTNAALTSKYNAKLVKMVKEKFPIADDTRTQVGSHFLREVYGNATYEVVDRLPTSRSAWLAQVLGHSGKSLLTAVSYQGVNIVTSVPLADFKYKEKLDNLDARVRSIGRASDAAAIRASKHVAVMQNKKGQYVQVKRFNRLRSTSEDEKKQRVAMAIRRLRRAGVSVTNRNTRKLGLSAVSVNQYISDLKRGGWK